MNVLGALNFDGLKYFYQTYLKPIKNAAYCTVVNNGTTTISNTVLDGRMGKTLADKDADLQRQINALGSGSGSSAPTYLWGGSVATGQQIYLSEMKNYSSLTFVFKRVDNFYFNATFLVSTLTKTTSSTGAQQMFNTETDATVYIDSYNPDYIGVWMTSNLKLVEIYGNK